ncbi:MAG TPA: hypothetical protein VGP83_00795 [Pyrinomonadaceae bacterium]|nr:hypothetical protein [Pyrinomonadaceae bacterium]
MSPHDLWRFLPIGYLFTIAIETPILLLGLSRHHSIKRRLLSGTWLTACTYPIVVLVLPLLLVNQSRTVYLSVAETFAPVAECLLFWAAFGKETRWRDFGVIVVANLASFLIGALIFTD